MRIRSTKPEFWRSERVASVSWDARLVLKGLESFVDDNGVGKDDLALIVADVFPRDLSRNPTGTLQKVSEALDDLSTAGLLWRYEVDGTRFLYVAFWESIQRIEKPTKGRFPRPDGTLNYRDSLIREASGNPPGEFREPSGLEQGNRGTGEQGNSGGGGDISTSPGTTATLEAAGLPPDEHEPFLQSLKDGGIRKVAAYVATAAASGNLTDRIKEWRLEQELAAKVPRVVKASVARVPRDGSGRPAAPVVCAHGGEQGRCPMCRPREAS
jgi:hypothetical protein